jgi:hypothetical protein
MPGSAYRWPESNQPIKQENRDNVIFQFRARMKLSKYLVLVEM